MDNFSLSQLKSSILKIKRLNRDNDEIIHFKIKYKTRRELYTFYKKYNFQFDNQWLNCYLDFKK